MLNGLFQRLLTLRSTQSQAPQSLSKSVADSPAGGDSFARTLQRAHQRQKSDAALTFRQNAGRPSLPELETAGRGNTAARAAVNATADISTTGLNMPASDHRQHQAGDHQGSVGADTLVRTESQSFPAPQSASIVDEGSFSLSIPLSDGPTADEPASETVTTDRVVGTGSLKAPRSGKSAGTVSALVHIQVHYQLDSEGNGSLRVVLPNTSSDFNLKAQIARTLLNEAPAPESVSGRYEISATRDSHSETAVPAVASSSASRSARQESAAATALVDGGEGRLVQNPSDDSSDKQSAAAALPKEKQGRSAADNPAGSTVDDSIHPGNRESQAIRTGTEHPSGRLGQSDLQLTSESEARAKRRSEALDAVVGSHKLEAARLTGKHTGVDAASQLPLSSSTANEPGSAVAQVRQSAAGVSAGPEEPSADNNSQQPGFQGAKTSVAAVPRSESNSLQSLQVPTSAARITDSANAASSVNTVQQMLAGRGQTFHTDTIVPAGIAVRPDGVVTGAYDTQASLPAAQPAESNAGKAIVAEPAAVSPSFAGTAERVTSLHFEGPQVSNKNQATGQGTGNMSRALRRLALDSSLRLTEGGSLTMPHIVKVSSSSTILGAGSSVSPELLVHEGNGKAQISLSLLSEFGDLNNSSERHQVRHRQGAGFRLLSDVIRTIEEAGVPIDKIVVRRLAPGVVDHKTALTQLSKDHQTESGLLTKGNEHSAASLRKGGIGEQLFTSIKPLSSERLGTLRQLQAVINGTTLDVVQRGDLSSASDPKLLSVGRRNGSVAVSLPAGKDIPLEQQQQGAVPKGDAFDQASGPKHLVKDFNPEGKAVRPQSSLIRHSEAGGTAGPQIAASLPVGASELGTESRRASLDNSGTSTLTSRKPDLMPELNDGKSDISLRSKSHGDRGTNGAATRSAADAEQGAGGRGVDGPRRDATARATGGIRPAEQRVGEQAAGRGDSAEHASGVAREPREQIRSAVASQDGDKAAIKGNQRIDGSNGGRQLEFPNPPNVKATMKMLEELQIANPQSNRLQAKRAETNAASAGDSLGSKAQDSSPSAPSVPIRSGRRQALIDPVAPKPQFTGDSTGSSEVRSDLEDLSSLPARRVMRSSTGTADQSESPLKHLSSDKSRSATATESKPDLNKPTVDLSRPVADAKKATAESIKTAIDSTKPAIDSGKPASHSGRSKTDSRQSASDAGRPATGSDKTTIGLTKIASNEVEPEPSQTRRLNSAQEFSTPGKAKAAIVSDKAGATPQNGQASNSPAGIYSEYAEATTLKAVPTSSRSENSGTRSGPVNTVQLPAAKASDKGLVQADARQYSEKENEITSHRRPRDTQAGMRDSIQSASKKGGDSNPGAMSILRNADSRQFNDVPVRSPGKVDAVPVRTVNSAHLAGTASELKTAPARQASSLGGDSKVETLLAASKNDVKNGDGLTRTANTLKLDEVVATNSRETEPKARSAARPDLASAKPGDGSTAMSETSPSRGQAVAQSGPLPKTERGGQQEAGKTRGPQSVNSSPGRTPATADSSVKSNEQFIADAKKVRQPSNSQAGAVSRTSANSGKSATEKTDPASKQAAAPVGREPTSQASRYEESSAQNIRKSPLDPFGNQSPSIQGERAKQSGANAAAKSSPASASASERRSESPAKIVNTADGEARRLYRNGESSTPRIDSQLAQADSGDSDTETTAARTTRNAAGASAKSNVSAPAPAVTETLPGLVDRAGKLDPQTTAVSNGALSGRDSGVSVDSDRQSGPGVTPTKMSTAGEQREASPQRQESPVASQPIDNPRARGRDTSESHQAVLSSRRAVDSPSLAKDLPTGHKPETAALPSVEPKSAHLEHRSPVLPVPSEQRDARLDTSSEQRVPSLAFKETARGQVRPDAVPPAATTDTKAAGIANDSGPAADSPVAKEVHSKFAESGSSPASIEKPTEQNGMSKADSATNMTLANRDDVVKSPEFAKSEFLNSGSRTADGRQFAAESRKEVTEAFAVPRERGHASQATAASGRAFERKAAGGFDKDDASTRQFSSRSAGAPHEPATADVQRQQVPVPVGMTMDNGAETLSLGDSFDADLALSDREIAALLRSERARKATEKADSAAPALKDDDLNRRQLAAQLLQRDTAPRQRDRSIHMRDASTPERVSASAGSESDAGQNQPQQDQHKSAQRQERELSIPLRGEQNSNAAALPDSGLEQGTQSAFQTSMTDQSARYGPERKAEHATEQPEERQRRQDAAGGSRATARGLPKAASRLLQTLKRVTVPKFAGTVFGALKSLPAGQGGTISLSMAPESLGQVLIDVQVIGGASKISIIAESLEAQKALEQQIPLLKDKLVKAGLQSESVDIRLRADQESLLRDDLAAQDKRKERQDREAQDGRRDLLRAFKMLGDLAASDEQAELPETEETPSDGRERFERYA